MLKDRKGISPIIGVILVVAMTVLLAVIAWTYLGGFTTTTPKQYLVSAKASENASGWITITYTGGPNHAQVKYLNVSVSVGNEVISVWSQNSTHFCATNGTAPVCNNVSISALQSVVVSPPGGLGNETTSPKIGTVVLINGTAGPDNNHVTVSATFVDGTTQTILDTWV